MLSKKSFGIAGAAMLGSVALLGTNAANAAINLYADAEDKEDAAATYAVETVTEEVESDLSGTYYMVSGAAATNPLDIRAESGVGAAQDETVIIEINVTGMVFGAALTDDSLRLYEDAEGTTDQLDGPERVLRRGGGEGEAMAIYHISNGDGTISQDNVLDLDVESMGVSMSGGSVTVEVRHELDDEEDAVSSSYTNAVRLESGVDEDSTPVDAMTYVARMYSDFGHVDPDADPLVISYLDNLGSFMIGVQHLNAADGEALDELQQIFGTEAFNITDDADLDAASVTLSGDDFDFAEAVWVDDAADCGATTPGQIPTGITNLWADHDDTDTDETKTILPVSLGDLGGTATGAATNAMFVCIGVSGQDDDDDVAVIPDTDAYMAMTMYEGVEDAIHPPMDGSIELGGINRDGITVHLPYLTTSSKFVQRLVIVNRNEHKVAYSVEYTDEAGKTSTPKAGMGSGTVEGDVTTIMKVADMVMVDGMPPRTSATLTLESVPGMVDVATTQINIEQGTTDTIVYEPEM